jgi:hypothetical protein
MMEKIKQMRTEIDDMKTEKELKDANILMLKNEIEVLTKKI